MLMHRDRRGTPLWANSGPPALRVALGSPLDFVAKLARATSPRFVPLLASEQPKTITVCKCGRFWV